jgi:hypothetical protein
MIHIYIYVHSRLELEGNPSELTRLTGRPAFAPTFRLIDTPNPVQGGGCLVPRLAKVLYMILRYDRNRKK